MIRWALLIEYDGAPFVGWQTQQNGLSIQQVLEDAAARLNGGEKVASIVAGRTDAGVHAAGQVAQIDLPDGWTEDKLRDALNFHMKPHPVVVLRAAPAPDGWNARFSAVARHYRYRILDRRARPALDQGRVWHVPHRLDVRRADDIIEITAEARSFLHHQVRNIAGTLKLVGIGQWPEARVAAALEARDRSAAGPTAPPDGLCLMGVRYQDDLWSESQLDTNT